MQDVHSTKFMQHGRWLFFSLPLVLAQDPEKSVIFSCFDHAMVFLVPSNDTPTVLRPLDLRRKAPSSLHLGVLRIFEMIQFDLGQFDLGFELGGENLENSVWPYCALRDSFLKPS